MPQRIQFEITWKIIKIRGQNKRTEYRSQYLITSHFMQKHVDLKAIFIFVLHNLVYTTVHGRVFWLVGHLMYTAVEIIRLHYYY